MATSDGNPKNVCIFNYPKPTVITQDSVSKEFFLYTATWSAKSGFSLVRHTEDRGADRKQDLGRALFDSSEFLARLEHEASTRKPLGEFLSRHPEILRDLREGRIAVRYDRELKPAESEKGRQHSLPRRMHGEDQDQPKPARRRIR